MGTQEAGSETSCVPSMCEQSTNHISLKKIYRPRCSTKSPTAQDVFRPIPVALGVQAIH